MGSLRPHVIHALAGLVIVAAAIVAVPGMASAYCSGGGSAKATYVPSGTWITAAEERNTTTWNYDCGNGSILASNLNTTVTHYWNPYIYFTSYINGNAWITNGRPAYIYGRSYGYYILRDWDGAAYYTYIYTYVFTSNASFGSYVRNCWLDGAFYPGSLTCGAV